MDDTQFTNLTEREKRIVEYGDTMYRLGKLAGRCESMQEQIDLMLYKDGRRVREAKK